MINHKSIAAKFIIVALFAGTPLFAAAQWAVIDAGNIVQTTISAYENIAQTAKQLDQYRKQLKQLEDQYRNTTGPKKYIWDEARITIKRIIKTANSLKKLKEQAGTIEKYLKENYGTVEKYLEEKCYSAKKCTPDEWKLLQAREAKSSEAQAHATEAMLHGLEEQQEGLQADADKLAEIQANAQTAEGRLEAMGYANQFASSQVNQLLQIRSLLIAQQTAEGMRQRAIEDQEAQQKAVGRQLREGEFKKSSGKVW